MPKLRNDIKTEDVVRLYESGLSLMKISVELDVSETVIRKRLASAGVKMRPASRTISEETVKKIRKYYADGVKTSTIAEICGVSVPTVTNHIPPELRRKKGERF